MVTFRKRARKAWRIIRYRRRYLIAQLSAVVILVCALVFALSDTDLLGLPRKRSHEYHHSHSHLHSHAHSHAHKHPVEPPHLVAAASRARQMALANAISAWKMGSPIPADLAAAAAPCPPEDAAVTVLRYSGHPNIVVDVGANGGFPVTSSAITANAKVVVSIEPDVRNLPPLHRQRARGNVSKFVVVHGAAGAHAQTMRMMFHKTRNDFTCMNCLDVKKKEVYTKLVMVKPVDMLLRELNASGPVTLLKTDTQGFEAQVLLGARQTFQDGRVHALIVEFDPKLLRTREAALELLRLIVSYGLHCVHLAFSGRSTHTPAVPRFPQHSITHANSEQFYQFVVGQTGWTDLFCLSAPS